MRHGASSRGGYSTSLNSCPAGTSRYPESLWGKGPLYTGQPDSGFRSMHLQYVSVLEFVFVATNTANGLSAYETFVNPMKAIVSGLFCVRLAARKTATAEIKAVTIINDHLSFRDTARSGLTFRLAAVCAV